MDRLRGRPSRTDGPVRRAPDGSKLTAITSAEDGLFSFGPMWSPDSTRLLFVRGPDEFDTTDLWKANVDGTGLAQVTHMPASYGGYAWMPSPETRS